MNPMDKGKRFEREIAHQLEKHFPELKGGVRRTPMSGAIHDFMAQDIICMDKTSILAELFIECKFRENLNHHKTYWRTSHVAPAGKIPIVVHRKKNDQEPIVTIGFLHFCDLIKELEDYRKGKNGQISSGNGSNSK